MATIKNGILGGFKGKIGTAVGYQIGDESFIRALPIRRAKPTKNELVNRAKFKLVQDILNPLKDFLKVGFKNYGTKTGGFRSAVSYTRKIALVADDTGIYIDPSLLKVSGGDLPQAVNPSVLFEDPMLITFSWDISNITYEHTSDQAMVVVYDMENKMAITRIFDGAFRRDGALTIEIPNDFKGKEVHMYIGFVSDDREKQSDSQYLGKIDIPA
jgi:hypothetical protein